MASPERLTTECSRCGQVFETWALGTPDIDADPALGDPGWMFAASEPHSGSVMAKAATASPAATRGSHSRFCSTVPKRLIAPEPSPCMAKAKSASPL